MPNHSSTIFLYFVSVGGAKLNLQQDLQTQLSWTEEDKQPGNLFRGKDKSYLLTKKSDRVCQFTLAKSQVNEHHMLLPPLFPPSSENRFLQIFSKKANYPVLVLTQIRTACLHHLEQASLLGYVVTLSTYRGNHNRVASALQQHMGISGMHSAQMQHRAKIRSHRSPTLEHV